MLRAQRHETDGPIGDVLPAPLLPPIARLRIHRHHASTQQRACREKVRHRVVAVEHGLRGVRFRATYTASIKWS
ncbi:MAG TPA: hypothetical protein VMW56_07840 [Candidatus Margulisiibacteriota bacterium]|nr:hypothetical protein [Candidatus Margulisiibacteriota bacterium]